LDAWIPVFTGMTGEKAGMRVIMWE